MPELTLAEEGLEVLFGTRDENLKRIERAFDVEVNARGNRLQIDGEPEKAALVERLLAQLSALLENGYRLQPTDVETAIRVVQEAPETPLLDFFMGEGVLATVRRLVAPRSVRQQLYLKAMGEFDLVISIGPAGTGKTYLAVAMAAAALKERQVRRIILARPAVEAGEKLGFLPGDLMDKVNPYLRPLYDALYDLIGFEKVAKLLERGTIEVAPIAFMRGRTLNDSVRDSRRGPEHDVRADEDVSDPDRFQFQGGDQRRYHADRSPLRQGLGFDRGAGGSGQRRGDRVHPLRRKGCGPTPAGAEDREGVRAT